MAGFGHGARPHDLSQPLLARYIKAGRALLAEMAEGALPPLVRSNGGRGGLAAPERKLAGQGLGQMVLGPVHRNPLDHLPVPLRRRATSRLAECALLEFPACNQIRCHAQPRHGQGCNAHQEHCDVSTLQRACPGVWWLFTLRIAHSRY